MAKDYVFPDFLSAGYGHVTKFRPIGWSGSDVWILPSYQ